MFLDTLLGGPMVYGAVIAMQGTTSSEDGTTTAGSGFGPPPPSPPGGFGSGSGAPTGGFGAPPQGGGSPGRGGSDRFASFYQQGPPPEPPAPKRSDGTKIGLLVGAGCAVVALLALFGGAAGWLLMVQRSETAVQPEVVAAPAASGTNAADAQAAVPVTPKDPSWGSRTAPVTLVVFSEFECPFCGKLAGTLGELKTKYGAEQLRIVFKHFPLPMHQQAEPAAAAAAAVFRAGGSEAFWRFHDQAFHNRKSLGDASFETWAEQAGVNRAAYRRELETGARAKVQADVALGKRLGVKGTPSSFINGIFVSGARDASHLGSIIDGQLAAARVARAAGTAPDRLYVELCNANHQAKPTEGTTKPKPEADSTTVWAIPVGPDDPVRGPAHAPVTIVEFADFQCPFCARVQTTLGQLREDYGDQLRIVWKDHPLPFHKRARAAATFAREAQKQRGDQGFWAAHDLIFAHQQRLTDDDLLGHAKELGLDGTRVGQALRSDAHRSLLQQGMAQAVDFDAKGTPQFFINGRRLEGAQPAEKFRPIIDEELAKARALSKSGVAASELYERIVADGKGPAGLETVTVAAPQPGAPYRGAATAPVVIQAFADFECPYCERVQPTLEQVLREHPGQVKIVFRHKPLPMHKHAALAAQAAQEAMDQRGHAGFWAMHDKLFAAQQTGGLDRPALERYASAVGLDLSEFRHALDGQDHAAYVEADVRAADAAGITGTPTFVVGRYLVKGAQPYVVFDKAIRKARQDRAGR